MTSKKTLAFTAYAHLCYTEALTGARHPEEKAKLMAVIAEPDPVPCTPSQLPDAVCKGRR